MYQYKVIVGTSEPHADGAPNYFLNVAETPKTLEAVLNRLAAEGWEPWHFVLPASYMGVSERSRESPVTLVFRREEPSEI
ncbi:MAG: hypothetical protein M3Y13_01270 [Armatimonadota bacterium]|nr:hypothetical protein [Armatimonadota bacterium]